MWERIGEVFLRDDKSHYGSRALVLEALGEDPSIASLGQGRRTTVLAASSSARLRKITL